MVQSNPAYQALKFEESEGKAKGYRGWWRVKMSAYALKTIPIESISQPGTFSAALKSIKDKVDAIVAVGKAVGADAVLVVDANMFLQRQSKYIWNTKYLVNCGDKNYFGNKTHRDEPGLAADLYSVADGRQLWSAALTDSVNIPTVAKMPWSLWGSWKYKLEEMAPDFDKTNKDLAGLLAYKLKSDASH